MTIHVSFILLAIHITLVTSCKQENKYVVIAITLCILHFDNDIV